LTACDEIGNVLQLKFSTGIAGGALPLSEQQTPSPELEKEWQQKRSENITPPRWRIEDVIRRGVQDVKSPLF
jgi:serine palmitoyltransferase